MKVGVRCSEKTEWENSEESGVRSSEENGEGQ